MTTQEIYETIKEWELVNGEDLFDQGFDLNEKTFMPWCLGRGYLTSEKFNLWVKNIHSLEARDANYYLYSSCDESAVPWAVVISDEWNEADLNKAYRIVSEFISEIDQYTARLKEFTQEEEAE